MSAIDILSTLRAKNGTCETFLCNVNSSFATTIIGICKCKVEWVSFLKHQTRMVKKRYEQPPASVGPTTATDRLHFVVVWHCRFYLGQQQENIIISPESRWAPDTERPGNLAQSPADHRDVLRPLPRGLQSPPGTQQEAEAYSEMQDRLGTPLWGLHQVRRSDPDNCGLDLSVFL